MNFELDIRTLSLTASFVGMMMGIVMLYVYSTQKTYNGFQFWVYASIAFFIGMILLSMRDVLPQFVTIIFANGASAVYFVLIPYGLNLFLKQNPSKRPYVIAMTIFVLLFLYFTYIDFNVSARIIIIELLKIVFLIYSAYSIIKYSKKINIKPNKILLYSFAIYSAYSLFRIMYTTTYESSITEFMSSSNIQAIMFIVKILGNISIFVGLIIYNLQRVERDFLDSTAEVKILQGIIPICMHCKGIRDDQGDWNQLEKYISEHSAAQFSHGICEKCARIHYPKMADKFKKGKK